LIACACLEFSAIRIRQSFIPISESIETDQFMSAIPFKSVKPDPTTICNGFKISTPIDEVGNPSGSLRVIWIVVISPLAAGIKISLETCGVNRTSISLTNWVAE
jgi:hypothetical protein